MGGIEFIEWLNAPLRILAMYVPIYFLWLPDFESFRYKKKTSILNSLFNFALCVSPCLPMDVSCIYYTPGIICSSIFDFEVVNGHFQYKFFN